MHGSCAPSEPSPMLFDGSGGPPCPQFKFKMVVGRWKMVDREDKQHDSDRLTLKYQAKVWKSSQNLGLPLQSRRDFGNLAREFIPGCFRVDVNSSPAVCEPKGGGISADNIVFFWNHHKNVF